MKKLIPVLLLAAILLGAFVYVQKSQADGDSVNNLIGRGLKPELAEVMGEVRVTAAAAATPGVAVKASQVVFTTVTTGSADSVQLPKKAVFRRDVVEFLNQGTGILSVYPPTGGTINNLGANAAFYVQSGQSTRCSRVIFTPTAETWFCNLSGTAPFIDQIGTLAALGTTQANCAVITQSVTRVTGADGTVGVCLPTITGVSIGRQYTIINSNTSNALKVYGSAGDSATITGQAGSTAISVAAKLFLRCWNYDQSSNWYCEKGVLPY